MNVVLSVGYCYPGGNTQLILEDLFKGIFRGNWLEFLFYSVLSKVTARPLWACQYNISYKRQGKGQLLKSLWITVLYTRTIDKIKNRVI